MEHLTALFRHNAWANRKLFDALRQAPSDFLGEPGAMDAEVTTRMQLLQHLVGVERGFADVLEGAAEMPEPPGDLATIIPYAATTDARLQALASAADEASLLQEHYVPWWERNIPAGVCLLQVLGHTGQHRAELALDLHRAGTDMGEIDYIGWHVKGEPAPGA